MKCFVIMPFGDSKKDEESKKKYDDIFNAIKRTIEKIQINDKEKKILTCHRADEEIGPGEIIAHVIENLVTSEIVIADLTGRNPNVFYELGVRHSVENKTILIAEDLEDIPFDLKGQRIISYRYDFKGMMNLQDLLQEAVEKLISDPEENDNPVRKFLYNRETERISKKETPSGFEAEKNILSELNHLKKEFAEQTKKMNALKKESADQRKEFAYKLAEQNKEIRKLMEWITSPQEDDAEIRKSGESNEIDMEFFEGNWNSIMTGSRLYAKIVKGKLLVPYCYSQRTKITGHYYNCRLVEKTLFARFEWFNNAVSGYIFLKIESENRLTGGWWYIEDLTSKEVNDISKINDSIPGMNEITLDRDTTSKEMPEWAKEYFEGLESENKD